MSIAIASDNLLCQPGGIGIPVALTGVGNWIVNTIELNVVFGAPNSAGQFNFTGYLYCGSMIFHWMGFLGNWNGVGPAFAITPGMKPGNRIFYDGLILPRGNSINFMPNSVFNTNDGIFSLLMTGTQSP